MVAMMIMIVVVVDVVDVGTALSCERDLMCTRPGKKPCLC